MHQEKGLIHLLGLSQANPLPANANEIVDEYIKSYKWLPDLSELTRYLRALTMSARGLYYPLITKRLSEYKAELFVKWMGSVAKRTETAEDHDWYRDVVLLAFCKYMHPNEDIDALWSEMIRDETIVEFSMGAGNVVTHEITDFISRSKSDRKIVAAKLKELEKNGVHDLIITSTV